MLPTIRAIVERDGRIRPLEHIDVHEGTHVIVTFLTETDEVALDPRAREKAALADLKGSVIRFDHPTDPADPDEWESA